MFVPRGMWCGRGRWTVLVTVLGVARL